MKKGKLVLASLIALLCIGAGFMFVNASSDTPTDKGKEIGQMVKSTFDKIAKDNSSNSLDTDPNRVVGTVDGVDIHAKDVELKATLYQAVGSKHPLEDAWDVLKLQAYEKSFAQKHDLLPSADEITQASQQMRKDAESSEDGKAFCDAIFQAMGMTADEYWNDYKPKYEMPAQLIHGNVLEYDGNHNLKPKSKKEIKGKLKDPILLSEYPDPDQTADQ